MNQTIHLNSESNTVKLSEKSIRLRKKEYQLLNFLLQNKNRVIDKQSVLEFVWEHDLFSNTKTLDVHLHHLRKKLQPDIFIKTVPKQGYIIST